MICHHVTNSGTYPCVLEVVTLRCRRDIPHVNTFTDNLTAMAYFISLGLTASGSYHGGTVAPTVFTMPYVSITTGFEFQKEFRVVSTRRRTLKPLATAKICIKKRFLDSTKFDGNVDLNVNLYQFRKNQVLKYYRVWGIPLYADTYNSGQDIILSPLNVTRLGESYFSNRRNADDQTQTICASCILPTIPTSASGIYFPTYVNTGQGTLGTADNIQANVVHSV